MSLLDSLLGAAGQNIDVAGIAARLGIDPATAEQAIGALGVAHAQPGDTVETAAAQTGIDTGTLARIAGQLGGSEGLGQLNQLIEAHPQLAGLYGALGGNADGGGILGFAKGLFGKE